MFNPAEMSLKELEFGEFVGYSLGGRLVGDCLFLPGCMVAEFVACNRFVGNSACRMFEGCLV